MKQVITLIAVLLMGYAASAQTQYSPVTDTVTNSEVVYQTGSKYVGTDGTFSIQSLITKIAGTISGYAVLQQSIDGTNWLNLQCPCNYGTTIGTTTDTVAVVNGSGAYPIIWNCTGIKAKSYRVKYDSGQSSASFQVKTSAVKE